MGHPVFAEAGSSPGIQIWTLINSEAVPVESKTYGKFYNGNSYIILKTTGESISSLVHDAHFWLGSKTTQDKQESAATLMVTLDDMLGRRVVQHREVQGYESSLFLGYFKPAIRYLEGVNESGFADVQIGAGAKKRLLMISGCGNMRIQEVADKASSLTKEHCFILEVEHDIFVLMADGAKATQRRKVISVANTLRDDYHDGRATIKIIDESCSDEDTSEFFEALGSGSKDDIMIESESTQVFTRDSKNVLLYKVLHGDDFQIVLIDKPHRQLKMSNIYTNMFIYILDTPCSGVYVWIGKAVDPKLRKTCYDIAQKYLETTGYPSWVSVTIVSEGAESINFKQYFHNWDAATIPFSSKGVCRVFDGDYFSDDKDERWDAAAHIGKSAVARRFMPDQGEGDLTVIRIEAGEKTDEIIYILPDEMTLFRTSEVYVFKYRYLDVSENDAHVVYWWIGSDAVTVDVEMGRNIVSEFEKKLAGSVIIFKVRQGNEPKHFLQIFKGHLVVLFGPNHPGSSKSDKLFRVKGTEIGVDMRVYQVPTPTEDLDETDVYVLENSIDILVKTGRSSSIENTRVALKFIETIIKADEKGKEIDILDVCDYECFTDYVGGPLICDDPHPLPSWEVNLNRRINSLPELFAATVSKTGKIKIEDLSSEYTQQDLSEDGVYILDTGDELYLWQGNDVPEREWKAREQIVMEYIKDDGLERSIETALLIIVRQGAEPDVFKQLFPKWDDNMWTCQVSYDKMKKEIIAANSK